MRPLFSLIITSLIYLQGVFALNMFIILGIFMIMMCIFLHSQHHCITVTFIKICCFKHVHIIGYCIILCFVYTTCTTDTSLGFMLISHQLCAGGITQDLIMTCIFFLAFFNISATRYFLSKYIAQLCS